MFISLCLQAVIIYGASAVFAVGWVWIVTQRHRDTAWRIPLLFLGVVFSKALLFFLLGVAMAIAAAATAMTGDGIGKNLGLIVMACAAMLLAAFSPLILLKHAPVIPGTSTSREGDGVTAGGAARAGRDVGTAARGARQAGKGLNKLSALAARSRKGNTGPVIGGGERPSRTPAPAPAADPPATAGRRRRRVLPARAGPTPPASAAGRRHRAAAAPDHRPGIGPGQRRAAPGRDRPGLAARRAGPAEPEPARHQHPHRQGPGTARARRPQRALLPRRIRTYRPRRQRRGRRGRGRPRRHRPGRPGRGRPGWPGNSTGPARTPRAGTALRRWRVSRRDPDECAGR